MNKEWYDAFYKTQSVDFLNHTDRHLLTASLCRGKVADIGCCMGILSDYYSGDYTGFDFSKVAMEKGRQIRRKDARLIFHDCSDLSGIDIENFDTFVMAEFLEHFTNDEKILEPIFKRAKPDSRIILTVPNGDRIPDPSHLRTLTIPELRKKFAPYGRVKFYNWPDAQRHILMTIDLGQKNDDLLSLVMIAKNEEKGLENAILSCIEFVDNIVIAVDNSSTDKTLEIAQRYADEVKIYDWENSFCKARNLAQEDLKTKWALHLDGHEFIEKKGELDQALNTDLNAITIRIILESGFSFWYPRLVRNYVEWEHDIHNNPKAKNIKRINNLLIKHDRTGLQNKEAIIMRNKQRNEMLEEIMGGILKKNKKDHRAHFYLAQNYYYNLNLKKALKHYKKYLKCSDNKQERWLARYEITQIYAIQGRHFKAIRQIWKAEEELGPRWETRQMLGIIYSMSKMYEQAIKYLVESFNAEPKEYLYNPERRDPAKIWDLIGICFWMLKNNDEAKTAWQRTIELEEQKPEKEQNKVRLKALKMLTK